LQSNQQQVSTRQVINLHSSLISISFVRSHTLQQQQHSASFNHSIHHSRHSHIISHPSFSLHHRTLFFSHTSSFSLSSIIFHLLFLHQHSHQSHSSSPLIILLFPSFFQHHCFIKPCKALDSKQAWHINPLFFAASTHYHKQPPNASIHLSHHQSITVHHIIFHPFHSHSMFWSQYRGNRVLLIIAVSLLYLSIFHLASQVRLQLSMQELPALPLGQRATMFTIKSHIHLPLFQYTLHSYLLKTSG